MPSLKKTYKITILFIAILITTLFLTSFKASNSDNENFTNCEKKVYSIESKIKQAAEMQNEHKIKDLEITLKRVNERCRSIL